MQHYEAGVNTNLGSNRFSQTLPIQHYEAGVNTNLPTNGFTQTQKGKVNTQSTNVTNHYQISTRNDTCKCEDKMDPAGIQYRSNFARELQQSQDMHIDETQSTQYQIHYLQQQAIPHAPYLTISHTPQQAIPHAQPPALQYR